MLSLKVVSVDARTIDELRPPKLAEQVVALGPETENGARLYAHLTGRTFARIDRPSKLATIDRPAVVVARYSDCTSQLFRELTEHPRSSAIGTITARSPERLHRALLASAAACVAGASGRARLRLAEVLPHYSSGAVETSDSIHLGRYAPSALVRRALAAGADLLVLSSHSDGIDAHLGEGMALCSAPTADARGADVAAPDCQLEGRCYRLQRSIAEAISASALVAPERLSARILLWHACRGFLFESGGLSPMWSVAERLVANAKIGAVILPWEATQFIPPTRELAIALLEGASAGEALGAYSQQPDVTRLGYPLVLLGDPRILLSAGATGVNWSYDAAMLAEQADRRDVAAPALAQTPPAHVNRLGDAFLNAILPTDSPVALDDVVAWAAGQRRGIGRTWEQLAEWTSLLDVPPCACCGELRTARRAALDGKVPGAAPRIVVNCPVCELVVDAPCDLPLELVIDDGTARIVGTLPLDPPRIALMLHTHVTHLQVPWTPNVGGRVVLPRIERPMRAVAAVLAGLRLAVLGATVWP